MNSTPDPSEARAPSRRWLHLLRERLPGRSLKRRLLLVFLLLAQVWELMWGTLTSLRLLPMMKNLMLLI